jgi:hypothetical protein
MAVFKSSQPEQSLLQTTAPQDESEQLVVKGIRLAIRRLFAFGLRKTV